MHRSTAAAAFGTDGSGAGQRFSASLEVSAGQAQGMEAKGMEAKGPAPVVFAAVLPAPKLD